MCAAAAPYPERPQRGGTGRPGSGGAVGRHAPCAVHAGRVEAVSGSRTPGRTLVAGWRRSVLAA